MNPSTQRGFFLPPLPIWLYVAAGAAVLVTLMGVALKVQTARLDAVRAEYAAFVAQTKAVGEAQEQKAKETAERNAKLAKEKDEDAKRRYAALESQFKRLRDAGSYRGLVPAAPSSAKDPDRACFNRALLNRALDEFVAEVAGITEAGERGLIDVNLLREWYREVIR